MDYLASFRSWLQTRSYSPSTIRNYLADLRQYLSTILSPAPTSVFSPDSLSAYLTKISTNPNSPRLLASLNLFCQFGLDQKLIESNPLRHLRQSQSSSPQPNISKLIDNYQQYLEQKKFSPVTIRNYINDLHQYIYFCESQKSN